ncbi:sensitivity to high expression protein she9 [Paecilomyces lecythidis]|uniref:Sensitive to high expression protein 9, mitochondrial n=1 Tax=Paecilomyces lecythidis TaxID=3004212 RepID=A0ABR3WY68_9EURO
MQSMPLLLRQSLRSSVGLARTTRSLRSPVLPTAPEALFLGRKSARTFSICPQCQFRTQSAFLFSGDQDKLKEGKVSGEEKKDVNELDRAKGELETETGPTTTKATENATQEQEQRNTGSQNGGIGRNLPSYLEDHRSQISKRFTTVMDNLQSNIFIAGQRLNDLTGYSAIETLKRDILDQGKIQCTSSRDEAISNCEITENRVRETRARVREAKDAYAAAINRRSTSQREVNELLQRKHAWSPSDLERFTLLYRNDHANEVAETEAQEALSAAEQDAEEAAARLSKSILSRYHEEQVWSDKIRRMSTWGTWGLMGVNVLLFLIFQVAVEPWRRKRLVKGFEEKVIEALEKERTILQIQEVTGAAEAAAAPAALAATPTTPTPATETTTDAIAAESAALAAGSEGTETVSLTKPEQVTAPAEQETISTTTTTSSGLQKPDYWQTQLPSTPSFSVESWKQYLHDLFSERSIAISQRDLTTVTIQSAAAGAAIMGLLIAIVRPR